ncbi:MAG: histidinol-phosphatase [Lachnospiraceae bacterium]|nr:histidinol-phosphatase [Lachnospiraceae bacterium]
MRTNYHTHTPLCRHAVGQNAAEYAASAFKEGFDILGFSDHAPFPDRDYGYRMLYEELPQYIKEIEALKKEYAPKGMAIYTGLEIEYFPRYLKFKSIPYGNYYEYLLNDLKLDYLLCGEHFFTTKDGEIMNLYNIDCQEQVIDYALSCSEAMSTGYFKILGHPDLFGVNDYPWNDIYDRATDIILNAAVKYGTIVEFNANGYRRGIHEFSDCDRYMYPLEPFWNKAKDADIKVIIGSDSHNPAEIWDYAREKALDYLGSLNIKPIETI